MRRSASEIIRSLEMRISRLERSSTRSALPPGFEGFGFDPVHDVPTSSISTARLFEKQYLRGLSKITDPNKLMKDHSFIEGGIHYGDNATFIYVDLPSSQAKKIGRKFFKNLKGKRNFPSHIPYFHDNLLVVGTNDGKITEVRNLL